MTDFAEVVDMFLEEADQAVKVLMAGLPADEVEGQLHFLKGSALNLGLADLAAICQDGERKAAAGYGALVDVGRVIRRLSTVPARCCCGGWPPKPQPDLDQEFGQRLIRGDVADTPDPRHPSDR